MPNPIAITASAISSHPHHGSAPSPESSVPVVDTGTTATAVAVLVCAGWVTVVVFEGWVSVRVTVFVGSVVFSAFGCVVAGVVLGLALACVAVVRASVFAVDAALRASAATVPPAPEPPEPHEDAAEARAAAAISAASALGCTRSSCRARSGVAAAWRQLPDPGDDHMRHRGRLSVIRASRASSEGGDRERPPGNALREPVRRLLERVLRDVERVVGRDEARDEEVVLGVAHALRAAQALDRRGGGQAAAWREHTRADLAELV